MKKTLYLSSVIAISTVLGAGTMANAATTWTGAIGETNDFMDDLATNHGWDKVNGNVTGYGVSSILTAMSGAATATDNVINAVNDTTTGLAATKAIADQNKNDIATINGSAVMTSGITATDVAQITTNKNDIATINGSAVMTSGITATDVAQITTNKNNIADLQGDVTQLKNDVAMNAAATSTAGYAAGDKVDAAVAAIDGALATAETNITTLQGAVTMANDATSSATYSTGDNVNSAVAAIDVALKTAEDKIGTAALAGTNRASATDLSSAVNNIDSAIGNRASLGSLNTTINTETGTSVAAGLKAAGDAIGSLDLSGTNYLTSATDLTTAVTTLDSTLKDTNDLLGTASGAMTSNSTALNGKTIGTDMSVIGALEQLAQDAATLGGNNTFTGTNTFNNANGITIQDGSAGNAVALKTGANGDGDTLLEISGADYLYSADAEFRSAVGLSVEDASHNEVFQANSTGVKVGDGTNDNFTVAAATGNVMTKGTVDINGATLTGTASDLTSSVKVVSANGFEIDDDNAFLSNSLKLAGTEVTSIDTDGSLVAGGDSGALATAATVKLGAEDADFTQTGANITAATTLGAAIQTLDNIIGDYTTISTTNGNLTGTDIVSDLNQIDTVIGDIANVSNTNNNLTGSDIASMLDSIDTNMGDLATLTHGAFNSNTGDITTAMNELATNVESATGGTFAADGTWSASVNNGGSVDYAYSTAATNLMGAIDQVASNIGGAVTGTNGNIVATNTVNQNLDALDTAIGTRTYTNGYNINDAEDITTSLDNIDTVIGDYGNLANANSNLDGTDIQHDLDMIDTVIGDRSALTSSNAAINNAVQTDLATAFNTTGNLIGDMDFSSTKFLAGSADLSDAVRTLDRNLERVETKLEKAEYKLKSGLAAVSALSALVPNARDCGNTQISVGTGVYGDRMGIAVGGFHYFNDHVLFNAGASYGGTRDWAFRAGVTFGL